MAGLAKRLTTRLWRELARGVARIAPASWLPAPKRRIFDCLMLYREIDLLEIRLNELYDHVDFFVIMESSRSFTGNENRPIFPDHAARFEKFRDKIRYVFLDEVPASAYVKNPMTPDTDTCEFWQRSQLRRGLTGAEDHDLIIYSDADEIPTISGIRRASFLLSAGEPMALLLQSWRLLYFDGVVDKPWRGSGVTTRANLRDHFEDDMNTLWGPRWTESPVAMVKDGGWHISFLGHADMIRTKMKACGHPSMQQDFLDALKERRFNGFHFNPQPSASLPGFVRDHPERWHSYMYSETAYRQLCEDLTNEPFAGNSPVEASSS